MRFRYWGQGHALPLQLSNWGVLRPYAHMRTPPRGVGGYWVFGLAKLSIHRCTRIMSDLETEELDRLRENW